jgi:hypothetical protein
LELINVNLASNEYYNKRTANLLRISAVALVLLITVYNIINFITFQKEIHGYEKSIAGMVQSSGNVKQIKYDGRIKVDENKIKSIQAKTEYVNQLIATDLYPWSRVLDALEEIIPDDMVLHEFLPADGSDKLILRGETGSTTSISYFLNRLNALDLFQNNLITKFNVMPVSSSAGATTNALRLHFEIESRLQVETLFTNNGYGDLGKLMVQTMN